MLTARVIQTTDATYALDAIDEEMSVPCMMRRLPAHCCCVPVGPGSAELVRCNIQNKRVNMTNCNKETRDYYEIRFVSSYGSLNFHPDCGKGAARFADFARLAADTGSDQGRRRRYCSACYEWAANIPE